MLVVEGSAFMRSEREVTQKNIYQFL